MYDGLTLDFAWDRNEGYSTSVVAIDMEALLVYLEDNSSVQCIMYLCCISYRCQQW
uniref:Uncharacterized protein n=1 Tax=Arion vulgaris TaxID=1028688 RepID=A0A0B7A4Y8_9EUPU